MPASAFTTNHKTGRTTVVCEYFTDKNGNIVGVNTAASTSAGDNAVENKVTRTKKGCGVNVNSERQKKKIRVSVARISYVDFFGRTATVTKVSGADGGGGVSIVAAPPGGGGSGRGRGHGGAAAGGGGNGGRPSVRPLQTLTTVNYQLAPQYPHIYDPAEVLALRSPSQRRILADPVLSMLFRVHPFGGGLVSIFANVASNAFVGLGVTVLPGGRVSTKAVLEFYCIVAGSVMGNARVTDHAFVHSRARIQDHATIGDMAWVDQDVWIGGKVTVGGTMNIITDSTGHIQIGGFGNIVGAFDIVGGGKLMTGSHAYMTVRQIEDLIRSTLP